MATRPKQQQIPGTEAPVIAEVNEIAETYCDVLYERMELQKREDTIRADLIEKMKKHGLETCEVDGYEVRMTTSPASEKIKVKTLQADGDED